MLFSVINYLLILVLVTNTINNSNSVRQSVYPNIFNEVSDFNDIVEKEYENDPGYQLKENEKSLKENNYRDAKFEDNLSVGSVFSTSIRSKISSLKNNLNPKHDIRYRESLPKPDIQNPGDKPTIHMVRFLPKQESTGREPFTDKEVGTQSENTNIPDYVYDFDNAKEDKSCANLKKIKGLLPIPLLESILINKLLESRDESKPYPIKYIINAVLPNVQEVPELDEPGTQQCLRSYLKRRKRQLEYLRERRANKHKHHRKTKKAQNNRYKSKYHGGKSPYRHPRNVNGNLDAKLNGMIDYIAKNQTFNDTLTYMPLVFGTVSPADSQMLLAGVKHNASTEERIMLEKILSWKSGHVPTVEGISMTPATIQQVTNVNHPTQNNLGVNNPGTSTGSSAVILEVASLKADATTLDGNKYNLNLNLNSPAVKKSIIEIMERQQNVQASEASSSKAKRQLTPQVASSSAVPTLANALSSVCPISTATAAPTSSAQLGFIVTTPAAIDEENMIPGILIYPKNVKQCKRSALNLPVSEVTLNDLLNSIDINKIIKDAYTPPSVDLDDIFGSPKSKKQCKSDKCDDETNNILEILRNINKESLTETEETTTSSTLSNIFFEEKPNLKYKNPEYMEARERLLKLKNDLRMVKEIQNIFDQVASIRKPEQNHYKGKRAAPMGKKSFIPIISQTDSNRYDPIMKGLINVRIWQKSHREPINKLTMSKVQRNDPQQLLKPTSKIKREDNHEDDNDEGTSKDMQNMNFENQNLISEMIANATTYFIKQDMNEFKKTTTAELRPFEKEKLFSKADELLKKETSCLTTSTVQVPDFISELLNGDSVGDSTDGRDSINDDAFNQEEASINDEEIEAKVSALIETETEGNHDREVAQMFSIADELMNDWSDATIMDQEREKQKNANKTISKAPQDKMCEINTDRPRREGSTYSYQRFDWGPHRKRKKNETTSESALHTICDLCQDELNDTLVKTTNHIYSEGVISTAAAGLEMDNTSTGTLTFAGSNNNLNETVISSEELKPSNTTIPFLFLTDIISGSFISILSMESGPTSESLFSKEPLDTTQQNVAVTETTLEQSNRLEDLFSNIFSKSSVSYKTAVESNVTELTVPEIFSAENKSTLISHSVKEILNETRPSTETNLEEYVSTVSETSTTIGISNFEDLLISTELIQIETFSAEETMTQDTLNHFSEETESSLSLEIESITPGFKDILISTDTFKNIQCSSLSENMTQQKETIEILNSIEESTLNSEQNINYSVTAETTVETTIISTEENFSVHKESKIKSAEESTLITEEITKRNEETTAANVQESEIFSVISAENTVVSIKESTLITEDNIEQSNLSTESTIYNISENIVETATESVLTTECIRNISEENTSNSQAIIFTTEVNEQKSTILEVPEMDSFQATTELLEISRDQDIKGTETVYMKHTKSETTNFQYNPKPSSSSYQVVTTGFSIAATEPVRPTISKEIRLELCGLYCEENFLNRSAYISIRNTEISIFTTSAFGESKIEKKVTNLEHNETNIKSTKELEFSTEFTGKSTVEITYSTEMAHSNTKSTEQSTITVEMAETAENVNILESFTKNITEFTPMPGESKTEEKVTNLEHNETNIRNTKELEFSTEVSGKSTVEITRNTEMAHSNTIYTEQSTITIEMAETTENINILESSTKNITEFTEEITLTTAISERMENSTFPEISWQTTEVVDTTTVIPTQKSAVSREQSTLAIKEKSAFSKEDITFKSTEEITIRSTSLKEETTKKSSPIEISTTISSSLQEEKEQETDSKDYYEDIEGNNTNEILKPETPITEFVGLEILPKTTKFVNKIKRTGVHHYTQIMEEMTIYNEDDEVVGITNISKLIYVYQMPELETEHVIGAIKTNTVNEYLTQTGQNFESIELESEATTAELSEELKTSLKHISGPDNNYQSESLDKPISWIKQEITHIPKENRNTVESSGMNRSMVEKTPEIVTSKSVFSQKTENSEGETSSETSGELEDESKVIEIITHSKIESSNKKHETGETSELNREIQSLTEFNESSSKYSEKSIKINTEMYSLEVTKSSQGIEIEFSRKSLENTSEISQSQRDNEKIENLSAIPITVSSTESYFEHFEKSEEVTIKNENKSTETYSSVETESSKVVEAESSETTLEHFSEVIQETSFALSQTLNQNENVEDLSTTKEIRIENKSIENSSKSTNSAIVTEISIGVSTIHVEEFYSITTESIQIVSETQSELLENISNLKKENLSTSKIKHKISESTQSEFITSKVASQENQVPEHFSQILSKSFTPSNFNNTHKLEHENHTNV